MNYKCLPGCSWLITQGRTVDDMHYDKDDKPWKHYLVWLYFCSRITDFNLQQRLINNNEDNTHNSALIIPSVLILSL